MRAEAELYARRDSPLHRWDARWKTVTVALVVVVVVTLDSLGAGVAGVLAAFGLLAWGRLPGQLVLRRLVAAQALLLPCLVILPLTVPGQPFASGPLYGSREGLELALLLNLRALAILGMVFGVVYSTPMVVWLRAVQALGFPHRLIEITLMTYRYLFTLGWELTRMRWALVVRGYRNRPTLATWRALAQVVGVTLLRSLERTERVQQALACRGFQGRLRTVCEFKAGPWDWAKSAVGVVLAAGLWLLDGWAGIT
jgi:cobalt/nickel transport system permease protein